MSERLVHLTADYVINTGCDKQWAMAESADGWCFRCRVHNTLFRPNGACPSLVEVCSTGTSLALPVRIAETLVERGQATYPTHQPVVEDSLQETLDRANALMDEEGLPHLNADSLRSISLQGKKGKRHYARPRDSRLAGELGIDPSDIADMRKLVKGD
ncbi:MAG: hypothetical protein DRJ03_30635 [Chloroflexi bacterium]|nr:MAG: hypothetical protein DRJ03_30635 [Chloroflexota bacterium]